MSNPIDRANIEAYFDRVANKLSTRDISQTVHEAKLMVHQDIGDNFRRRTGPKALVIGIDRHSIALSLPGRRNTNITPLRIIEAGLFHSLRDIVRTVGKVKFP